MKFKLLVLIILILLFHNPTYSSRIMNPSKIAKIEKNLLYKFLDGFLTEFGEGPNLILSCINKVKKWKRVGKIENKTPIKFGVDSNKYDKILDLVGNPIDMICLMKKKLKRFYTKNYQENNTMMFVLKISKNSNLTSSKWSTTIFVEKHKAFINKVANFISSKNGVLNFTTIKKVNYSLKKPEVVFNYLSKVIRNTLRTLFDEIELQKEEIIFLFTKNKIMKVFYKFSKCFNKILEKRKKKEKNKESIRDTLNETLENYMKLKSTIKTNKGWVTFVVNMICGYKSLVVAVPHKIAAEKDPNNLTKYESLGKYIANYIKSLMP